MKPCNNFADFSKREYFLAHGRPKLVCVQFKGSQAQITIRNGHNSCKCMIKMIIIYDDCTINDRRPNQVKRLRNATAPLTLCAKLNAPIDDSAPCDIALHFYPKTQFSRCYVLNLPPYRYNRIRHCFLAYYTITH